MANTSVDMDKIVSLCKRRGFIFQSSEIYGGLASTFDYGPYGVELKRNVKEAWWKAMIWERDDMVGLDAAILMHPEVWVASGHVAGFHDPLVECGVCNQRFRPDQISYAAVLDPRGDLVGYEVEQTPSGKLPDAEIVRAAVKRHPSSDKTFASSLRIGKRSSYLDLLEKAKELPCPLCGEVGKLTEPREFSLMFKTHVGPVEDSASIAYLRPETAQGIFVNFGNIQTTTRRKLPFGVGQIGKSFRNEITPGNFIFRTREFEQMEIEYFCSPDQGFKWHDEWKKTRMGWYSRYGINPEHLRFRDHGADELAHYAKATADIEYLFPFGWGEIEGIAYRTDFDLKAHQERSGKPLTYFDEEKKEHYVPHVVEPSCGVDRPLLAFLVDAYVEEDVRGETRTVLKLHKALAPVKVAILPLSRNERLTPKAREVYELVRKASLGYVEYDDAQSIGRRYRRQDEIGTPLCVTVDFETVEKDNAVTIRDRDTMEQVRVPVEELVKTLVERLRS